MIKLSAAFDLGRDTTRIKDPRDADRQTETAAVLLSRLFHQDPKLRWELQILADEVGMGKTFVALAVALTLLEEMMAGRPPTDLEGCYQKVVILTPPNHSLLNKWFREVSEFVARCGNDAQRKELQGWFKPVRCDRLDDFVRNLRRRGPGARLIVAPMDIFGEKKLHHYDVKRRFLLGALFRYWGNRFQLDRRERLLKGSPEGWPKRPEELPSLLGEEADDIPCSEEEALEALRRLDRPDTEGKPSLVENLLDRCRAISDLYVRDRDERFASVAKELNWLYREVVLSLLRSPVPLVIVDEVHNWKNGPSRGANGYELFAKHLASRTRRALLLTATPFQLRPQEMLELLKIGEALQPVPERSGADERRERFRKQREEILSKVLDRADKTSRRFSRSWSRLSNLDQPGIGELWKSDILEAARHRIEKLAMQEGLVVEPDLTLIVNESTAPLDISVRSFFADALMLYAHNRDLSHELGPLVVRHRRQTEHRVFRVGREYGGDPALAEARPDRHVLHAALGLDVRGEAELPHYLLMRCVSDTKNGKGRSSLGSALTGCYSTLMESAEGKRIQEWLKKQPHSTRHFELLLRLVHRSEDPAHPKLLKVVEEVLQAWHRGEKSLLFCFRTNTAERLREIILARITKELTDRRQKCLGGETSLVALRGRLTSRDGDLMPLVLDRTLWSLAVTQGFGGGWPFDTEALQLQPADISELARTCLQHGMSLDDERADRVFLTRAVEHTIARRLLRDKPTGRAGDVLRQMAEVAWVELPYGLEQETSEESESGDDEGFLPRGVHSVYPVKLGEPSATEVEALASRISQRRTRARTAGDTPIFDIDAEGPSLWFGGAPKDVVGNPAGVVTLIHEHMGKLTLGEKELDWNSRRLAFEALRRILLRESMLVRLLPDRTERQERAWGELLVEAFWKRSGEGQPESMARRTEVFLEDLLGASGSFTEEGSARWTLLDATRLRDQSFVALVKGGDQKGRERVFAGFNTPLLPDVLVCTSVGAEGIDLHRQCRHVIHYDLAWNPAVLEQRTGRIDRIGSKTFRDRTLSENHGNTFLEVGVPFLAGTYDERMYEELRLRAQIFEVLTGGEVAADNLEGLDDVEQAEGKEGDLRLVPLPTAMTDDLRVHLHVWAPKEIRIEG